MKKYLVWPYVKILFEIKNYCSYMLGKATSYSYYWLPEEFAEVLQTNGWSDPTSIHFTSWTTRLIVTFFLFKFLLFCKVAGYSDQNPSAGRGSCGAKSSLTIASINK